MPFFALLAYNAYGGDMMQFDRNALNRLLMLNDKQLETVVKKLAEEYGLDLARLNLDPDNIKELRNTLRRADDATLQSLGEQLRSGKLKP